MDRPLGGEDTFTTASPTSKMPLDRGLASLCQNGGSLAALVFERLFVDRPDPPWRESRQEVLVLQLSTVQVVEEA